MSSSSSPPPNPTATAFSEWLADLERFINDPPTLDKLEKLPERMIEGLQAVTTEIYRSVIDFEIPTLSLPLPPFLSTPPPPAPPPPPPPLIFHKAVIQRVSKFTSDHPYITSIAGVGLGVGMVGYGVGKEVKRRETGREGRRGRVVDGFMVDAVLIISPSRNPLLLPLILLLLRSRYVVLLGLKELEEVEHLERVLRALGERPNANANAGAGMGMGRGGGKGRGRGERGTVGGKKEREGDLTVGVWVGVLDVDDPTSVQAFHRSLHAALTTRYPCPFPVDPPSGPISMGDAKLAMGRGRGDGGRPSVKHLPKIRSVWNMYGLATGGTGKGEKRVPPVLGLLKPPASYASFTALGATSIEEEDPRSLATSTTASGTNKPAKASKEHERPISLYTFLPTRTLWPLSREFDGQLTALENLLLGRNAVLESSQRSKSGKERKRGETTLVLGKHVEVYVGDMQRALEGLDLRRLARPSIRSRIGGSGWYDARPYKALSTAEIAWKRYLAPARLAVDVVIGTVSWPGRYLWAGISALRRESRRRDEWDDMERALCGNMSGVWSWGVLGIGRSATWPYVLASILPTQFLAFMLNRTPILGALPPLLPPARSFSPQPASSTPSENTGPSPVHGTPEPSEETGTMPSLDESFMSGGSSWTGVGGSE